MDSWTRIRILFGVGSLQWCDFIRMGMFQCLDMNWIGLDIRSRRNIWILFSQRIPDLFYQKTDLSFLLNDFSSPVDVLTPDVQRFDCGVSVCLSVHLLRPWSLQNDWANTGAIWHYTRVGLRNNVQDWGVHIFTGIGLWVGGSGPFCCTVRSKEIITAAADCNAFRCHIIFSHTNLPSAVMWPVAGLFWAILSLLLALPS